MLNQVHPVLSSCTAIAKPAIEEGAKEAVKVLIQVTGMQATTSYFNFLAAFENKWDAFKQQDMFVLQSHQACQWVVHSSLQRQRMSESSLIITCIILKPLIDELLVLLVIPPSYRCLVVRFRVCSFNVQLCSVFRAELLHQLLIQPHHCGGHLVHTHLQTIALDMPLPYSMMVAEYFSTVWVQGGTVGNCCMAHAVQTSIQSARNEFALLEL